MLAVLLRWGRHLLAIIPKFWGRAPRLLILMIAIVLALVYASD